MHGRTASQGTIPELTQPSAKALGKRPADSAETLLLPDSHEDFLDIDLIRGEMDKVFASDAQKILVKSLRGQAAKHFLNNLQAVNFDITFFRGRFLDLPLVHRPFTKD